MTLKVLTLKVFSSGDSSSMMTCNQWERKSHCLAEHWTDLLNLYREKTSLKQTLFLKPVICHLPCNSLVPFSVPVVHQWKHWGNNAIINMLLSNLSEKSLFSLLTCSEYGLHPIYIKKQTNKKTNIVFY